MSVTRKQIAALLAAGLPLLGTAAMSFVPARPALAATAAQDDHPAEAASTSRLTGATLPGGAFRLTDTGALGELTTQLKAVATEGGFILGQTEVILWGGAGHDDARNGKVKSALVQALKGSGYSYEVAVEENTKDGKVTFFTAGKAGAKKATLGFWVAGDTHLLLAWGDITPKEGVKPAVNAAASGATDNPTATTRIVPADLAGTWSWTTISSVGYRDTITKQLAEPSGMSARFTFTPQGRYDYFWYTRQRTYNLVTEATSTHQGTVTFNGDGTFTLQPEKGHYKGSTGSRLIDRPMTQEEKKSMTFVYEWRTEDGKRQLYIGPSKNSLSRFKPGE